MLSNHGSMGRHAILLSILLAYCGGDSVDALDPAREVDGLGGHHGAVGLRVKTYRGLPL